MGSEQNYQLFYVISIINKSGHFYSNTNNLMLEKLQNYYIQWKCTYFI